MLTFWKNKFKNLLHGITAVASTIRNFQPGSLIFRCNICGWITVTSSDNLGRETISCLHCGSTVRMRMVIHALSTVLFGESFIIRNFPERSDIRVIGLSDWDGYAVPLAGKLAYTNTFYHQEPRLDILSIDPSLIGTLDVLISSDVFEHVAPPVSLAFENAFQLLKPNGTFIFTVPYTFESNTKEHFPDLYKYEIRQERGGKSVLYNVTRDGHEQKFENLNFHGGAGETLEMRLFSLDGIKYELRNVGFHKIDVVHEPNLMYGLFLKDGWSLPIIARKP